MLPFQRRGFNFAYNCSHNHLYINQKQMNLAQYPKLGNFIKISASENQTKIKGTIGINDSHIYTWKFHPNIMTWGYWSAGWSGSTQRVSKIDPNKQIVYIEEASRISYPPKQGKPIMFFNILEEIKYPGDFCIDFETKIIYFLPFEKLNSKTEIFLSNLTAPVITAYKKRDIIIKDLSIECTSHHGIRLTQCNNVLIERLKIFNIGMDGINCNGNNITIRNCLIHNTFDNGIFIVGGNRLTLENGNNLIYRTEIYWFGNLSRNYYVAVAAYGVGTTIRNCLFYNAPHSAVIWGGNDHIFEYNEFHDILMESDDAGVFYTGSDYTYQGNIFRYNYIHDCRQAPSKFIIGIYFDFCSGGV